MGRYYAKIGSSYIEMGDWEFDYVKDGEPEDYYKDYTINATLGSPDGENNIKIPLLRLGHLVKDGQDLSFVPDFRGGFLMKYLWDEYFGDGITCCVQVQLFRDSLYDKDGREVPISERPDFWLNSPIGDDEIILSTKPKVLELKKFDDFFWLEKNYLVSVNKKITMDYIDDILNSEFPDRRKVAKLIKYSGRRTGRTCRIIDACIQDIFRKGVCFVRDHHPSRNADKDAFERLLRRLTNEHGWDGKIYASREIAGKAPDPNEVFYVCVDDLSVRLVHFDEMMLKAKKIEEAIDSLKN